MITIFILNHNLLSTYLDIIIKHSLPSPIYKEQRITINLDLHVHVVIGDFYHHINLGPIINLFMPSLIFKVQRLTKYIIVT